MYLYEMPEATLTERVDRQGSVGARAAQDIHHRPPPALGLKPSPPNLRAALLLSAIFNQLSTANHSALEFATSITNSSD
ncbi:hypothetical protein Mal15_68400 [Stieleria maiorica]|uniref:Uncharacterized protein n=2 Tax=Stieleria maiorica TaxID=2795974 RepID=A0A5B9MMX3_9BACT|nr:hypothetical protein Mal15_68400 [Stieleria maiorica]